MPASVLAPAWLSYPDSSNALRAQEWASDVVRHPAGELAIDGVSVHRLAEEFGSPLFVMSEADFRRRAREFRDSFNAAFADICGGVDVYYAGKSFLCTEVARWVISEGLRLDTCSGGELLVAERAGVPAESLSLHGNNKSEAELRRALALGVGRIVADSLSEIERIDQLAGELGVRANVMLRLTPGVHAHTHEFIATAHEDQKFGLSLAELTSDTGERSSIAEQAVLAVHHSERINFLGLHCHIGSQIFDAEGFAEAARRLLAFSADLRDQHGIAVSELDLGGGYGIAYTEADTPRPTAEIAEQMASVVRAECVKHGLSAPRISIEPGRAIVGPSTFTLYRVGTVKTVLVDQPAAGEQPAERRYIAVDGGMSDNPRPVLYEADYTAVLANRASSAAPVLSRVVGKHCESGDIVVRDVYLPDDVAAGDLLAVPATGAYCWSLASNYNYLPRPAVVAVRDGVPRVIVRAETEEDLLARDPGA
ncbi:diaminopimelate decarboxylase [Psychromicrobium lacuslunae]|uniref:Diaminopimelate decarboxylase n=1 Tax=Psychromicrobium lacuslunae TaxID=1618207 RepID=A0A0D4BZ13_9MICC|nr:diaminopimelate decarboxylase [Psychromicrobium lacuslunae]AJT41356.1 diaminopimelate decarboxylase [Psychromicrobium lacuslunae]